MFVSVFAVLALALSAVAAPLGVPQTGTSQVGTTNPSAHDVATTNPNAHDVGKTNTHEHDDGTTVKVNLPMITSPGEHVIWHDGQEYPVSWNLDDVTDELKQKTGVLVLGHPGAALDYANPLVKDVPLNKGSVNVKPNAPAGDYVVALVIADSGEAKSHEFSIQSA